MLANNLMQPQAEISSVGQSAAANPFGSFIRSPMDQLQFGLSLLGSAGPSPNPVNLGASMTNSIAAMQQLQRQREQDMMQRQLQQSQLASQQFNLQQAQRQAALEIQRQQQLSALVGEEPSMVNNFQGSGYLGGKLSPMDILKKTGLSLLSTGDEKTGANLLAMASNPYLYYTDAQKNLAGAGIDPMSPQGRAILQQDVLGKTPQGQIEQKRLEGANSKLSEIDAGTLKDAIAAGDTSSQLINLLKQYKDLSNSITTWDQGPVVGHLSKYWDADNYGRLQNLSARIVPMAKVLSKFPQQRLAVQELNFLISGGLSPTNTIDAVNKSIDSMIPQAQENVDRARFYRDYFDKNQNLSNVEDKFIGAQQAKNNNPVTPTITMGVGLPAMPGSSASPVTPLVVPGMKASMPKATVPSGHPLAGQPITKVYDYSHFGGK